MAHHVYTTEGFVLESTATGEANKIYTLFTRELGMIRATAQGVRLLKSKLRFSLQDFSYATISVVRGKDIWRITNAKAGWSLYDYTRHSREALQACAHISLLLRRLIAGEEKNEELFDILIQAFQFFIIQDFERERVSAFERIMVIKMLHNLGYIGYVPELNEFIDSVWSETLLTHMIDKKRVAVQEINTSLRETQL